MDELIDAFFKQCETGRVQIGEFFYNIHFRINYYLDDNVLLVPYDSLNSHGLLKCVIPDKIFIQGVGFRTNFLVGISNEAIKMDGIDCILHCKLIERNG